MKVERPNNFVPVVITIESEDELRALWHRLNLSWHKVKPPFENSEGCPIPSAELDDWSMWEALDKFVNPGRYK